MRFFLSSLFVILIFSGIRAQQDTANRGYIVEVGDPMPEVSIRTIEDKVLTNKDFEGKVVMLQFTASWCSVCRKEMPHIESDIWQACKDREDFVLIGIDREEPLEKILMMKEATAVTYPLAFDEDASLFKSVAMPKAGITRNVILDRDGKIAFLTRLFEQEEFDAMKARIAELLDSPSN